MEPPIVLPCRPSVATIGAMPSSRADRLPPLLRPPRLQPGDEARVLSMSGTFPESSWKTSQWFGEALGLRVTFGKSLSQDRGYLGRDPRRRADDFNSAIRDDAVRAILLFRGGNTAAEVLPHLDYALIRRSPKVVVGFSDHSSVVNGIHAKTGLVTFLLPPMLQAPLGRRRHASVSSFRDQASGPATTRSASGGRGARSGARAGALGGSSPATWRCFAICSELPTSLRSRAPCSPGRRSESRCRTST